MLPLSRYLKSLDRRLYFCTFIIVKNLLSKIVLIGLPVLLMTMISCNRKPPNYPIIPHIEFKEAVKNTDGSLTLKFNFTDGDADIGIPQDQGQNFFYDLFEKSGSTWITDLTNIGYNVPPMDNGYSKGYEGEIDVHIDKPFPNNTFKYKWKIYDRAGHVSNEVYTYEIAP